MPNDEGLFKKRIMPYLKAWREDCVCGEDGFWKIFEDAKKEFYEWLCLKPTKGGGIVDMAQLIEKWFGK